MGRSCAARLTPGRHQGCFWNPAGHPPGPNPQTALVRVRRGIADETVLGPIFGPLIAPVQILNPLYWIGVVGGEEESVKQRRRVSEERKLYLWKRIEKQQAKLTLLTEVKDRYSALKKARAKVIVPFAV